MRKYLFIVLIFMICFHGVSADFSELIEFSGTTYNTWTLGQDAVFNSNNALGISISDYNVANQINGATNIRFDPVGYVDFLVPLYASVTVAPLQLKVDSDVVATGTMYIKADSNGYELLELTLDNPVNMMGMTGFHVISPTVYVNGAWRAIQAKRTGENKLYVSSAINPEGFYLRGYYGSAYYMCGTLYYDRTVPYKAQLDINTTPYENYALSEIQLNRNIAGIIYPSWFMVLDYIGNTYIASGNSVEEIEFTTTTTYPVYLNVSFGDDILLYTYSMTYYANSSYVVNPIVTPTIIPTPTPTPVPELCGYWSLAVNTSNILMNEYVQGTLTETDTSDRYDMIDWYRVLPSGQEILALHYVYDPGLFGMGAGWFEVTPTGAAYASSAAEAMENDIQFTTAGVNYLRAKIYDDKSILPMVYHDYDLVCTLSQVVYVGETTQASNTLGINVKECDTNAVLTGVSIGVYDYLTGQWSNKTSEYGGTTYFNVVPGHNVRVVANKTGWLSSDTDYTIPASPGLYEVCLKRPLIDVVNESYVFFNVRDSVTLTGLFQANIQLSDGQIQNTLPSGYAGFSVNDSETYIYTVTKPGYQSFSDSFSISEDTTIPVRLVQISPTPTLTYPVTTLPTVTITGTGTVTPTGTGTGVWSNTTATLSPTDKTYKTTKGLDIWYMNLETLSGLLFVAAVFGAIGLISDSMGRRRRR